MNRPAPESLSVLGSVLLIGAHPDDENTALLTYLTRARKVRAAYLSLTRGEGGQNLIGSEQGDLLGVIRTQELLAARRIDGAEQFFTRAIDFGFSKSAQETLDTWGHDAVLGDVVWTIRRYRPDVVVQVFTGTARDGHGHHQASGILAREAFSVAADRSRYSEQLGWVEPWQAKRLLQSSHARPAGSGPAIDIGSSEFDPVLGRTHAEIARMSHGMHRSQGMGGPERRGVTSASLFYLAGEPVTRDIFDGIDITWNRVPGGRAVRPVLEQAMREFEPGQPDKSIPLLLQARALIAALKDPWAALKLEELNEAIVLYSGLRLGASTEVSTVCPGATLRVNLEAVARSRSPLRLKNVSLEGMPGVSANESVSRPIQISIPAEQPYSQPYWLRETHGMGRFKVDDQELAGLAESPAPLRARFRIEAGSQEFEIVRPVVQRYADPVTGETATPIVVAPPVSVRISEPVLVFPEAKAKNVDVALRGHSAPVSGVLRLEAPPGWKIEPVFYEFRIGNMDEETTPSFTITPPAESRRAELRAIATVDGREITTDMLVIAYPGLPPQTVFSPSTAVLVRTDVRTLARRVGYVMGAGDEAPRALRQLGCEVTLLSAEELAGGDLSRFETIVAGVRAYNVRTDLRANQQRLFDFVKAGGTFIVQYNVADGRSPQAVAKVGPYPLHLGRSRVTDEKAPVGFLNPKSPLLRAPNKITPEDFDGWVQERGLYFAAEWDPRYEPLFECHDPGEPPLQGATLYTRHGKGAYIFTAYSWFRQLPAGVPGAYRIFANFLSAAKAAR